MATLTPPKTAAPTMPPPAKGVKVRMYRQGLGDCFLLAFPTSQPGQAFYLLIDCGVILGTPNPADKMQKVAADIEAATGGDIHLLVSTHEHWDHLSGFIQAGAIFGRLRIHNLWFAWTEDPADALANKLRAEFGKDKEALCAAVNRAFSPAAVEGIRNVVEFFGDVPGGASQALAGAAAPAAGGGSNTGAALTALRGFLKTQNGALAYRHPGEGPLPLPAVAGLGTPENVRIYVLGPPHDETALRQIDPTAKGQEVYTMTGSALTAQASFRMAVLPPGEDGAPEDRDLYELSFPFDQRLRIPLAEADQSDFFQKHYGGFAHHLKPAKGKAAPGGPQAWRRIDDDWLGAAGDLALQLDSFTNNTSLALAIELADTGKVLLMAADAQVGNWLSWGALQWTVDDGKAGKQQVHIADLFARTVLYKVGHHASHNATMRAQGLELMTSPDLVAMIPVDENIAHNVKHWNQMPFTPLLTRLAQKTCGRVLRVDQDLPKTAPAESDAATWAAFLKQTHADPLYYEYEIDG